MSRRRTAAASSWFALLFLATAALTSCDGLGGADPGTGRLLVAGGGDVDPGGAQLVVSAFDM